MQSLRGGVLEKSTPAFQLPTPGRTARLEAPRYGYVRMMTLEGLPLGTSPVPVPVPVSTFNGLIILGMEVVNTGYQVPGT